MKAKTNCLQDEDKCVIFQNLKNIRKSKFSSNNENEGKHVEVKLDNNYNLDKPTIR
jgi:hypothetical protein